MLIFRQPVEVFRQSLPLGYSFLLLWPVIDGLAQLFTVNSGW